MPFPDATNTGVAAGTTLTVSGSLVIYQDGTVINGLDIIGTVNIEANDVTIENCSITGATAAGVVQIDAAYSGTTVENCTINGAGAGDEGTGITGSGTFTGNNISGVESGIAVAGSSIDTPTLIENNYIHDLLASGSPHYDGVKIDGDLSDVTISDNTIINQNDQTSAIQINNDQGPVSDVTVTGNLLGGGGYTIYDVAPENSAITGVSITNNDIAPGLYGDTDFSGTSPTYAGNTDDGAALIGALNTSPGSFTLATSAPDIVIDASGAEALTPTAIDQLASAGVTQIEVTGGPLQPSAAQIEAIGENQITVIDPGGVAVTDNVSLGGQSLTFDAGADTTLDLSGTIADGVGSGSLVLQGPGTVRLDGPNTFTGGISAEQGALELGSSQAAGFGPITMDAGTTLEFASGGLTVANALSIAGDPIFNVAAGQTETVAGVISDTVAAPGVVEVTGGGTLALDNANAYSGGTLIDAGTLELGNAHAAGTGAVTFNGPNATLQIDVTQPQVKEIDGFALSDTIEIADLGSSDTMKFSGQTVTISGTTGSETLTFGAGTNTSAIQFTASATPGEDILTICFMAGTLVRTPDGETAVETLKRGDLVLTSEGAAKPVSWLGKQTVSALFADPVRSWPIRVKVGALDENVPCRDLLLSPDHALRVGDVLIQAGALVNGTSIVRETTVPRAFVYYHVELDDHSLILAENTPAETFVDNVDRLGFDNWAEHEALYPEGKPIEELPFPRAKGRRQVPMRIRAALDERAKIICAADVLAVA